MISEGFQNHENQGENFQIDYSKWDLVTTVEAARRLGVSEKTVYNRYNKGDLNGEERPDRLYVWVQKEAEKPEKVLKSTENDNNLQKIIERILSLSERVESQSEEILKTKQELSEKRNELIVLNRDIEARNNQIIRVKDFQKEAIQLRTEVEMLRRENQNLKNRSIFDVFFKK